MFSRMIIGVLSASVLFSHRSSALVARGAPASSSWPTLKFTTTVYSGIATASGYPGVQRDGTGGGQVSGHNIMAFSDTQTPKDGPTGYSWESNSYAYLTDISNPLNVQDFGSHGHPEQMVPWGEGECSPTDPTDHGGWYIWPNNPLTTQFNDGSDPEAYAIFGVGTRVSATVWPWSYNTLCKITANDTGLTVTRPVQKYITPDFKYKWGWATASHTDGVFRIFATQGQSLYIAKVGWDEIEDTSKFSYYSGTGPCKDEASEAGWCKDETSAAPIAAGDYGGSSGDVFWSPHYNKWVAIFMSGDSSGSTFWVSYSTTPHAHGPYTEAQKIFDPSWGNEGNYGGHGHSKFFGIDAKDVLLSWTVNGTLTEMAKLTFDP